MKRLIIFLITASVLTLLFTGCNSSDNNTADTTVADTEILEEPGNIHKTADIIGSWKLKTITDADFMCQTVEEYCNAENIKLSDFQDTFTFNKDNTATYELNGKKLSGTYEFDDPTYAMTCKFGDVNYNMTYDNRYDMFYLTDTKSGITKEYGRQA